MLFGRKIGAEFGEQELFFVLEVAEDEYIAIPASAPIEMVKKIAMFIEPRVYNSLPSQRVRIYEGNPVTGKIDTDRPRTRKQRLNDPEDDFFDFDENPRLKNGMWEGYLCASASKIELRLQGGKYKDIIANGLLIMFKKYSRCGHSVDLENVVKIEYSNKRDGGTIWEHPTFHFDDDPFPFCHTEDIMEDVVTLWQARTMYKTA